MSPITPPSVSVIVAAHNEEKYIGRCIRSILNQSLPKEQYEIIVVNDGSVDRTHYALNLFEGDIRILHNETNVGLPASLNRAISQAHGQFIIRLDADDYVNREYLNVMRLFLSQNPYMDAVACDYFLVDDQENVLERKSCLEAPLGCGIMFRVEQLIDIGLYDPSFTLHEDKDLMVRFLQKYKVHRIELPLYRYRRHGENMTNNREMDRLHSRRLEEKHGITII